MPRSPKRFENKVAIITGSGRGIGKQLAMDMASEGGRIVITDIDQEAMEATAKEIRTNGGECLAIPCDVSEAKSIEDLTRRVLDEWSTVDVLVNNAGLLLVGGIEEMTDKIIHDTLEVNVKGVLYAIRAVSPVMKENRYGKIVNVASVTGKNGDSSTFPVYGASKGAVITLTRSVARELGPYGINCNAVAPHAVMTEMMSYWDEERKERARAKIPLHRLGSVEDIANLMMFLASDEASFITGETVNINGGFYMD